MPQPPSSTGPVSLFGAAFTIVGLEEARAVGRHLRRPRTAAASAPQKNFGCVVGGLGESAVPDRERGRERPSRKERTPAWAAQLRNNHRNDAEFRKEGRNDKRPCDGPSKSMKTKERRTEITSNVIHFNSYSYYYNIMLSTLIVIVIIMLSTLIVIVMLSTLIVASYYT